MDNPEISRMHLEVCPDIGGVLSLVEFEDGRCALMHNGRVIAGPWRDMDVPEAMRASRLIQAAQAAQVKR